MIYKFYGATIFKAPNIDGTTKDIPVNSPIGLQIDGPMLPVIITQPNVIMHLMHAGGQSAVSISCNALLDTGAGICAITPQLAEDLGLKQTGVGYVTGVHGSEARPEYFGKLQFPWGNTKEVKLTACELSGVDCIIGRDIMSEWYMVYDGINGEVTICV
jgi:hypothetical protein